MKYKHACMTSILRREGWTAYNMARVYMKTWGDYRVDIYLKVVSRLGYSKMIKIEYSKRDTASNYFIPFPRYSFPEHVIEELDSLLKELKTCRK